MKIKIKHKKSALLYRIGLGVGIGALVLSILPFGSISAETENSQLEMQRERDKERIENVQKTRVESNNAKNIKTQDMRARLDAKIDPRLRASTTASTSAKKVPPQPLRQLKNNASSTATTRLNKKIEDRNDRDDDDRNERGKGQGNGAICSRIISSESQILANLTKSLREKGGARKVNINQNREDKDNKLDERRDEHDENKSIRYEKLEAGAKTDAQVAAVAKFKTTMEGTITTRRTAVDLAISTYRKDVDAIIAKYPPTNPASTTAAQLEAAAKEAIAQAKTACNATSTDQQVILKNFQASLEKLKNDYKSTMKSSANIQASSTSAMKLELKAAAQKRDTSIKSAREAFRTVYTTAKAELRLAFGLKVDGNASTTRP